MFGHEFVIDAYLAGTFVALACGAAGWFVVLRAEVFAGDALSHVAFVGAIAAALLGLDERIGLFSLTLVVAWAMAVLGPRGNSDDVVIGVVFAWILGIGILLITLLSRTGGGDSALATANTLFGSIYSLTASAARLAAAIGLVVVVAIVLAYRPLLSASLDPELARARGIPVRLLSIGFLAALAIVTAESTQAVGALLLLGLLAAPAGAAHRLAANPYLGFALSGLFAVVAMWGGLALSYAIGSLPPSSAIIGLAAAIYASSALLARLRAARGYRAPTRTPGALRSG